MKLITEIWFFGFGAVAITRITVGYFVLRRLSHYHVDIYTQLGTPTVWDFISSFPENWSRQWRLFKFIWCGQYLSLQDKTLSQLTLGFIASTLCLFGWLLLTFVLIFNHSRIG